MPSTMPRVLFIVLALAILSLGGLAILPGLVQTGANGSEPAEVHGEVYTDIVWEEWGSPVTYIEDTKNEVGIWIYRGSSKGGIAVLPFHQYK